MKTTRIHVNQHIIKRNKKCGEQEAPLTVKDYSRNRRASTAILRDSSGKEVARVVYRPGNPLSCGATCWVETQLTVDTE